MDNKLKELTEKIYADGVAKANADSIEIIAKAQNEASDFVKKAKDEATKIIADANKLAEDIKLRTASEVKQASQQTIKTLQQEIASLILAKNIEEPIKDAFNDKTFLKNIIETAVKNFGQNNGDVNLILSKSDGELSDYFIANAKKIMNNGLTVTVDPTLKAGFKIGPSDNSYQISFKEDDFIALFKNYLRPKTVDFLYSGK